MSQGRPIAIFDSGIGGLTVASAIRRELPGVPLVYFGDTAHLPYGDKSPEAIRSYAQRIASFLHGFDPGALVIACNTASSYAWKELNQQYGKFYPVINVIDPVVEYLQQAGIKGPVGVIGTRGTINSRVYPRKIRAIMPQLKVRTQSTPLLAPMVEEGFFNNSISRAVIGGYLEKPGLRGIKALVLACTHYPLIQKEISAYYQGKVQILDSAGITARSVARIWQAGEAQGSASDGGASRVPSTRNKFFVSDFTHSFDKSARMFFGEDIHLENMPLF